MSTFDFTQLHGHHHIVNAGDTIFQYGDLGTAMYILLEGDIHITLESHLLDTLSGGTVFGEMALVDAQPRSANAIAHTRCKLVEVTETRFAELAHQYPTFGLEVMRIMSERTRRLMQEGVKRIRLEEELSIGRKIQLGLLPQTLPEIPNWDFGAHYEAASQVGGDLYDFILNQKTPDKLQILVADVTGKGIPAAMFMATMRSTLRTLAYQNLTPADILEQTNRAIVEDMRSPLFISSFFTQLTLSTGELTFASAGHDWPLLYRAKTKTIETIELSGFVLGMFPQLGAQQETIQLDPNDCLLVYTDGITEARNAEKEFFDDDRLAHALRDNVHRPAQEIADAIVTAVQTFSADTPRSDDLTLVVIKRR